MDGVNVLYNTAYAVLSPNAIISMQSDDEKIFARFCQNIEYSTFDNVVAVKEGDKSLSIDYGCNNDRIFMQYNDGDKIVKKSYVGNCEYVEENGEVKALTYIEGPMGVFAVHLVKDGNVSIQADVVIASNDDVYFSMFE